MEPLRSRYVTSAAGGKDDRTSGSAPDYPDVKLEVSAAHRETALVEQRAEHDAPRVLEMRAYAARPGAAARGLPFGAIKHLGRGEVVARVVARAAVAGGEASAVHGARHGGKPRQVLGVVPAVEVGVVLIVDVGGDHIMVGRLRVGRRALPFADRRQARAAPVAALLDRRAGGEYRRRLHPRVDIGLRAV